MAKLQNYAKKTEQGMTLVELVIALAILAFGLGAIMLLITVAMAANTGSKLDTSATMIAQMVAEQIGSVPASSGLPVNITDCSGLPLIIATAGAAGPTGAGAQLLAPPAPRAGDIDWNGQAFGAINGNYKMTYNACGPNNNQQRFEVRWNVTNLAQIPGPPVQVVTKLVTVSARRREQPGVGSRAAGLNRIAFSIPVTIRTIVGQ